MTTIEELKTKISEAKNASDAPSVYIAGSINGGSSLSTSAPQAPTTTKPPAMPWDN